MTSTTLTFPTPSSLGSLDHYIQAVNRFPLLTQEQETELGRAWREREDIDAARQLVLSHLRLVVAVSRNYLGYGLPQADAARLVFEDREEVLGERLQILEAPRRHGAGEPVAPQIEALSREMDGLVEPGEEDGPLLRPGGGDEQAMVAAAVRSGDRRPGPAAEPVGLQPFDPGRPLEVLRDLSVQLNRHTYTLLRRAAGSVQTGSGGNAPPGRAV